MFTWQRELNFCDGILSVGGDKFPLFGATLETAGASVVVKTRQQTVIKLHCACEMEAKRCVNVLGTATKPRAKYCKEDDRNDRRDQRRSSAPAICCGPRVSIDAHTELPADLFDDMMKAARQAKNRGAHRLVRSRNGSLELRMPEPSYETIRLGVAVHAATIESL